MEPTHDRSLTDVGLPWFELDEGDANGAPPPAAPRARALFAATVKPWPFDQRAEWRWGWNADNTRQEAQTRQQQFLTGLRDAGRFEYRAPPAGPTLALHAYHDPDGAGLALCLLGAADGPDADGARAAAADLWHTVRTAFPYDYEVAPVPSRREFFNRSGLALLDELAAPRDVVEIQRFEMRLSTGHGPGLLLGLWQGDERADELVWRALAAAPRPALLSIRLRPTQLAEWEWPRLQAVMDFPAAPETASPVLRRHYRWAAELYEKRLHGWQLPYLVQIHLAVPGGVPDYLARAIGAALTGGQGKDQAPQPLYQVVPPADCAALYDWQLALYRASFTGAATASPWLRRVHLLAGPDEAATVFHWPYPSKGGLPGVEFS